MLSWQFLFLVYNNVKQSESLTSNANAWLVLLPLFDDCNLKLVHLKSNVVDPDPYVLDLPDPDASLLCTDPYPSINKQKLLFDFLSLKIDVNIPQSVINKKTSKKNLPFVGRLSATDEQSMIRIRIRKSELRIRGSGSILKCHRFTTLYKRLTQPLCWMFGF